MHITTAMMVMVDRTIPAGPVGDVERRGVVSGRRLGLIMLVIVVDRGGLGIGYARELQGVFKAMPGVDHAMRLQRDQDGHAEADAEEAERLRQQKSPIFATRGNRATTQRAGRHSRRPLMKTPFHGRRRKADVQPVCAFGPGGPDRFDQLWSA